MKKKQSLFKNLLNNIKYIFKRFINCFKDFFKNTKCYFKKSTVKIPVLFSLAIVLCATSSIVISKNTHLNCPTTLIEIAQKYKSDNNAEPNGVVYPKKLISEDVMTYRMPEFSQALRSAYGDATIFDFYQSNWEGLYSPGIVKMNNTDVPVSFLMLPRLNTYITKNWLYKIPTLYPQENPLENFRGPNDIFINKEYADYIIDKTRKGKGDYKAICNDNLDLEYRTIPYSWNYGKAGEHAPQKFDVTYSIKGVLDSSSKEYQNYKRMFGDFFVTNEYFSMPLPCCTYFSVKMDSRNYEKLITSAYNKYVYDAVSTSKGYNQTKWFEYRITYFGDIDSKNSIKNIYTTPSTYNKLTDQMYEYYLSKINIVHFALFLVINLIVIFGFTYIIKKVVNKNDYLYNIKIGSTALFFFILSAISLTAGVTIMLLLNRFIPFMAITSFKNILGFTLAFAETIILTSIFLVISHRATKTKNKTIQ